MPKISVVIPCYNRTQVVLRAVRSALMQTHQVLEVIVVDDGSDDPNSLKTALQQVDDSRVCYIRHPVNRNGAAARNTGIREAKGDLIAFLDSDDEWMPEKLELQIQYYEKLQNPKAVIYCQSIVLSAAGQDKVTRIWPSREISSDERLGDYLFLNRGYLPTPSILMGKELALSCPFNETLRRHQDYDLLLRLEAAGSVFSMIKQPLVTVHWEELHKTARGLDPEQSLEFLKNYRQFLSRRAASAFANQQVVSRLLRAGQRKKAFRLMRRHVCWTHLRPIDWLGCLSLVLFTDDRIPKALAMIKNKLKLLIIR